MLAQEQDRIGVAGLCDALSKFIDQNRGARDEATRWLADYLVETLRMAQHVRSGNLSDSEKKLIASFRLGELQKAKDEKQREIAELDREAKKLTEAVNQ